MHEPCTMRNELTHRIELQIEVANGWAPYWDVDGKSDVGSFLFTSDATFGCIRWCMVKEGPRCRPCDDKSNRRASRGNPGGLRPVPGQLRKMPWRRWKRTRQSPAGVLRAPGLCDRWRSLLAAHTRATVTWNASMEQAAARSALADCRLAPQHPAGDSIACGLHQAIVSVLKTFSVLVCRTPSNCSCGSSKEKPHELGRHGISKNV